MPQPISNSTFKQWDGQQCDFGHKVIHSPTRVNIKRVSGGAKTLKSADLNGDGEADLAAISLFDGKVFTLINDGAGTFTESIVTDSMQYPSSLDLHDWDNDSDQDLLVVDYAKREIILFINDGNGNFSTSEAITLPDATPYALSVIDVNDDSAPDLVVSSFDADVSGDLFVLVKSISQPSTDVYINQDGSFELLKNISSSAALTVDALKQESTDELVIASAEIAEDRVVVYRNGRSDIVDTGGSPYGVNFSDLDGNGTHDLLVAYYRPSELAVIYQSDDNSFSQPSLITTANDGLTAVAMADFDGDGMTDVASGEFNAHSFFYFPTTSYVDCVLNTDTDRTMIAVFSEGEQTAAPPEVPASTQKNNEASGGGSIGIGILIIGVGIGLRKRFATFYL